MIFGNAQSFGIECLHEPLPNKSARVFGRMCLFVGGNVLGDIREPACMLNVTESHLLEVLGRLPILRDMAIEDLDDFEAFSFLDRALYLNDDRSNEEIQNDATRFFKFDFLTNGGESFDNTKSFIVGSDTNLRILFKDAEDEFHSAAVPTSEFENVVQQFLQWLVAEGKNAKG